MSTIAKKPFIQGSFIQKSNKSTQISALNKSNVKNTPILPKQNKCNHMIPFSICADNSYTYSAE